MKPEKTKEELDNDLKEIIGSNNSFMVRIELLLIQIIRLLKKKP